MASIKDHTQRIREHLEEIDDAINQGIDKKPVTIGFHCSVCSIELLELYLHKTNKIPIGKIIKHDWFKRPKAGQKIEPLIERKMPISFPDKEEIYELIYSIEDNRNSLMYGSPPHERIKRVLLHFQKLREIIIPKVQDDLEQ